MTQRDIASEIIDLLTADGRFESVSLSGSMAEGTPDEMSDIDILVHCGDRSPWENVVLASSIVEKKFGCLLRDWAGSLLPEKYLISHFLPNQSIFHWLDLGCLRNERYGDLQRTDLPEDRDVHLAKLLVMNAKHYLREDEDRLRIKALYRKALNRTEENRSVSEMFTEVHDLIEYSTIGLEFHFQTQKVLEKVANKSAQVLP